MKFLMAEELAPDGSVEAESLIVSSRGDLTTLELADGTVLKVDRAELLDALSPAPAEEAA